MRRAFILLLFVSIFFLGCQEEKPISPSGNEIKVGILAPLKGPDQRYGKQSLKGIEAVNELKSYLNNGDKIRFVVANTYSNAEGLKKALQKLQNEKVAVIVSFVGSNQMLHVKDQFKKIDIPIITTLATNDEIVHLSPHTTQVCMSNHSQAIVASHFIKDEKLMENVIVVYHSDSLYSKELSEEFIQNFQQLDGHIQATFDFSDPTNVKRFEKFNKKKTDMIFSITNIRHNLHIVKTIDEQNLKTKIMFSDGFISSVLEEDPKKLSLFEGDYVIEHFTHEPKIFLKNQDFFKKLQKFHLEKSSYALLAYDAYMLVYDVLNLCGDEYSKDCLNTYFVNMPIVKGISGNFSIVNSQARREIYVNKIFHSKLIQEIVTY